MFKEVNVDSFISTLRFENVQVTCFGFASSGCQWKDLEAGFDFFKHSKFIFFFDFFISIIVTRFNYVRCIYNEICG